MPSNVSYVYPLIHHLLHVIQLKSLNGNEVHLMLLCTNGFGAPLSETVLNGLLQAPFYN